MKKIFSKSMFVVLALLVAVCGLLPFASNALAEEQTVISDKTYYVSADVAYTDTTGEPNNREKPYNVNYLLSSNSILKAGDTVKIIPGNYELTATITITVSGTYDHYITIENESSTEQATLGFYNQLFGSTKRGVEIEGDYIHWNDVDICGAGDNGLYIGGSYNIVENCEFYDNRDSGLQLGRSNGELTTIDEWPSYNLIRNCTSHNNYDNETKGENADGFAAKLTIGYGNVFDGCIAYRNSDDGWDLYAKIDTGNIGAVIIYNCVAFENGFLEYNQETCNAKFPNYETSYNEAVTTNYDTNDGDGNGFKLGGSVMEGDVVMVNCLAFNNKLHGVTDNSNPGSISITGVTSFDNGRTIDNDTTSENYGQVIAKGEEAGNIDVARQTYSYNNMEGVLSLKSASVTGLTADAYRASVQDSILTNYKIEGSLDADTKNSINGEKITQPVASDVFEQLPVEYATSGANTYNFSGLNDFDNGENRIHVRCRNADGSINMGSLFAVKDYSKLLGEDNKIGAILNLESYDAYEHFDLTNDYSSVTSESDAILKAAKEALTINVNAGAVYQNFYVATNMKNVEIGWTSSDSEILEVTSQGKDGTATSNAQFVYLIVHRGASDAHVTLTATVKYGSESVEKDFDITVKQADPKIGDIFVTYKNGENIYNGESLILAQHMIAEEPTVSVLNGSDYSGTEFVSGDEYLVETTYEYATSRLADFVTVHTFTSSNAGVWRITHKVTLNSSNETKTFRYYIYSASNDADVDFVGEASVSVNLNGYSIAGELSNVTGTLYTVVSATELELTADNIKDAEGVEQYEFADDSVFVNFENDNTAGYYVYYALANKRDVITSEVYSARIEAVSISTCDEFMSVAGGNTLGGEEISRTIYSLTACLDFSGKTWTVSSQSFKGYLNGNGHKISNVTVNGVGMFFKVEGGTITNIRFDNIVINGGSSQKVGIFSSVYGGYFNNIQITNVKAVGGQRTGALIGQIFDASMPTYISQVSVINEIPEIDSSTGALKDESVGYYIKANGNRASSLVAFIQPASTMTGDLEVYISDCYTQSYVMSTGYSVSGIVAEYDDSKALSASYNFALEIRNCITASTLVDTGTGRVGGMLAYHKGGSAVKVTRCVSLTTMYYKGLILTSAQKNLSGIIGNGATGYTTVSQCYALIDEYNSDYGVTSYAESQFAKYGKAVFFNTLKFDESIWELVESDGKVVKPYIRLIFSACECAD